jgi:hypothetical protein
MRSQHSRSTFVLTLLPHMQEQAAIKVEQILSGGICFTNRSEPARQDTLFGNLAEEGVYGRGCSARKTRGG